MFVDGDKAVCGSYSFTWSAARIDRNLISVLTGQVVESFDRQFQDLYLFSKGVSLKNIPMDNEPEPEPLPQITCMPTGPSESIAKKMINPKYALVKTKSASDTAAELKQEKNSSNCNNMVNKAKAKAAEQLQEESHKHPALQNMERANMFEYLPTWVEPDPEPGSDILGYINIIDPSIKNPQPSQMNRIKICDTSQATTQYLLQNKEQETTQVPNEEGSVNHQERTISNPEQIDRVTTRDKESSSQSPGNQGSKEVNEKLKENTLGQNKDTSSLTASPSEDSLQSPKDKQFTPCQSNASKLSQTKQNQSIPSQRKASTSSQSSQDDQSTLRQGDKSVSWENSPEIESNGNKEEHSVSMKDEQSLEASSSCEGIVKDSVKETTDKLEDTHGKGSQEKLEGFASLISSKHLIPYDKGQMIEPPVPKPRTLPVSDFINMKNAENAKTEDASKEQSSVPSVNGLDVEGTEDTDNEEYEDAPDGLCNEYSSSGSSSLPPSSNSSLSEECFRATALQRRNSDHITNGDCFPMQRKLSEGRISRGSFLSPLHTPLAMMETRQMENEKRRNSTLEEELKRALTNSRQSQGKDTIYSLEQGKPAYRFGTSGTSPGYDRLQIHRQAKNPLRGRGRKEMPGGLQGFGQATRKPEGVGGRHSIWSSKDYPSVLPSNPAPPENPTTPFGIPFSKLSQAKHLKNKLGAANADSRRRGHGPFGHKEN
ncbi:hypothetical protein GDO86_020269 [Hymenochirus boettgeri]|nr:hypothetical protein GDO86_020269 [Hymenochirus boettgeri]